MKILIAEDDQITQLFHQVIMKDWGYKWWATEFSRINV